MKKNYLPIRAQTWIMAVELVVEKKAYFVLIGFASLQNR